jgi:hypothetical protein
MFKKIEEVRRNTTRSRIEETHAQIYKAIKNKIFSLNIHQDLMEQAKLCIGDRTIVYLAEDNRGSKWLVIEADGQGYKLVAASAKSNKLRAAKHGTCDRAIFKTTVVDNFLSKYFEDRVTWKSNEAETRVGSIAFPLEKKKVWFQR